MRLEDFKSHLEEDFGKLLPAEVRLIRGLRGYPDVEVDDAEFIVIGTDLPDVGDESRRIRAELIRWLALGGGAEAKTPERGLNVRGAWIDGCLDLDGVTLRGDLGLIWCRFDAPPSLRGARCASLFLDGTHMPGLNADRLVCSGGVFLRSAKSTEAVQLRGADIGGDLACNGAELGTDGKGDALVADVALVAGGLFLRDKFSATGGIVLTHATLGALADDEACWPNGRTGWFGLNGCTYGAVYSRSWDAKSRLRWLALARTGFTVDDFYPQPYEQLAKVFRVSGHPGDARAVLIEKERLQRQSRRRRLWKGGARGKAEACWRGFWDTLSAITVRYGRQPLWAFAWLVGFAALGTNMFFAASQSDAIKPNSAVVLRAPEWTACAVLAGSNVHDYHTKDGTTDLHGRAKPHESQRVCFERQPEAASWPEFNAFVYSLDTLLPIVDLEMQTYWIPDEDKGRIGAAGRIYLWIQIAMGWALSLLAVAGFSGLVKSD